VTALVLLVLVQCMRGLALWRPRGRPFGKSLCVAALAGMLAFHAGQALRLARQHERFAELRAGIVSELEDAGGEHLILVRYGPKHSFHEEWVYNGADLDGVPVLWARHGDKGESGLLEYYPEPQGLAPRGGFRRGAGEARAVLALSAAAILGAQRLAMITTLSSSLRCSLARKRLVPRRKLISGPTSLERDAGWVALFDGRSTEHWRGWQSDAFPASGWETSEGCLHRKPGESGGDLITREVYDEFELELEWKIAPLGNSGIKVRVVESDDRPSALGPEYQIADDAAAEIDRPEHSCGALYELFAPDSKPTLALDGFHATRIVVREGWIEHWLDGVRVVRAKIGDDEWQRRIAASKFKDVARFGEEPGHVLLQDHGGEVWFRRIEIRDLAHPVGTPVELYDGKSLAGWRAYGDARWTPEADGLLGERAGGSHSFLATEREFGDFLLEVDVKNEGPGNSGIQVRSHVGPDGRMQGYQIEIDPSARAWSGGLYDEGRRAWLQDLDGKEAARAAFHSGEWNRFRIECVGPSIKAWVNGVPTADYLDAMDLSGVIALQVHGGEDTRVRWRNFRLWSLGTRTWRPMFDGHTLDGWDIDELGSSELGARLQILDGAIVASPGDSAVGDDLVSQNLVRDFTVRVGLEDVTGQLQVGLEDLDNLEGFRETPGVIVPMDSRAGRIELVLHVYGSHIGVDRNGQRFWEYQGPIEHPGGPVSLSCWNLSHPARFVAIDVLAPLESR
jgi:hypothetical protein